MKGDFTRSTWDRRKRYSSVRMQQGRVQVDADWNEQADILTALRETALRSMLGDGAAPLDGGGFAIRVAPAAEGGSDDLLIADGRLWIDGVLCELGPEPWASIDERLADDRVRIAEGALEAGALRAGDWVEIGAEDDESGAMARIASLEDDDRTLVLDRAIDDPGEGARLRRWTSLGTQRDLPSATGGAGVDLASGMYLVYLDAWRWHVTALEDPAIRESALGGPDTATRQKVVCQARLLSLGEAIDDDGNPLPGAFTCDQALPEWDAVTAPATGRLRARTRPETDPDDPCVVPSGGGYVGLENQLYRVEVHDGGTLSAESNDGEAGDPTFKWSRDNATVVSDWLGIEGDVLRVRSVGRDRTLSFHDARWVELTDDGRELRGEPGVLVRLLKVVDDQHLEIDAGGQALALEDFPLHPKVRRWDLPDSADGALPITLGAPENDGYLTLESGIEVRFEAGTYRTGDHWWIPARAFVGDRRGSIEWPVDGGGAPLAAPARGIAHHYMRLALVAHDGEGFVAGSETDCRDLFCTLPDACRRGDGGCCTVTVGAGAFATLQEAVDGLPASGGEVCVLPGTYDAPLAILDRRSITVRGCGGRPRLRASGATSVVRVVGGGEITLRGLEIDAGDGIGVALEAQNGVPAEDVMLEDLEIAASEDSAISARGVRRVAIRDCRVRVVPLATPAEGAIGTRPAVYLAGDALSVLDCRIESPSIAAAGLLPAGGLTIGGGSRHVRVQGNRIRGGHGNGITLGSVRPVPRDVVRDPTRLRDRFSRTPFEVPARIFAIDAAALDEPILVWNPNPPDDDDRAVVSEGDLESVSIEGNEIADMGANGVAVASFFDLADGVDADELITVSELEIVDNRVHDCLGLGLGAFPESLRAHAAYGAISLAGGEHVSIRDNVLEDNGRARLEPVCGVYVLNGVGLDLEGNRIIGNGRTADAEVEPLPGNRGGIVIGMAESPTDPITLAGRNRTGLRQDGTPALRVHGNVVVAPEGRALEAVALGPVSIVGNQLTSLGSHSLAARPVPGQPIAPFDDVAAAGAGAADAAADAAAAGVDGAAFGLRATARIHAAADLPLGVVGQGPDPVRTFLDTVGGAVVAVVDLGVSNEVFLQVNGFSGTGLAGVRDDLAAADDERLLVGGNVLFHDNQVVLDALRPAVTVAPTAISLFSWDDVSMLGNQCDCDLAFDAALINALVMGTSVRVTDNRFKEGPLVLLSALTWAWLNATHGNQGTHCFLAAGHPLLSQTRPNASVVDVVPALAIGPTCERWTGTGDALSAAIAQLLPGS